MTSFKAEIKTPGDKNWASNGLRFANADAAEAYALDLSWRWTQVAEWRVVEADEEPNR